MIKIEEQFYCVGCATMVTIEHAEVLFRTGFFRSIHPMGCCTTCSTYIEKVMAERAAQSPVNGLEKIMPLSAYIDNESYLFSNYSSNVSLYSTAIV
ncbi:MAG: hypothetical protein ACE3L7_08915 [Candidatus Pristimantibacillus sp.]